MQCSPLITLKSFVRFDPLSPAAFLLTRDPQATGLSHPLPSLLKRNVLISESPQATVSQTVNIQQSNPPEGNGRLYYPLMRCRLVLARFTDTISTYLTRSRSHSALITQHCRPGQ